MKAIRSSLEDVQNSQVALVQKLAQIEANLMNNPDKEVEAGVSEMHSNAAQNADIVRDVLDKFNARVDKADREFTPSPEDEEGEES